MKITITIDTGDACFHDEQGKLTGEVRRILHKAAVLIDDDSLPFEGPLFSIDGNRVGHISITEGDS